MSMDLDAMVRDADALESQSLKAGYGETLETECASHIRDLVGEVLRLRAEQARAWKPEPVSELRKRLHARRESDFARLSADGFVEPPAAITEPDSPQE